MRRLALFIVVLAACGGGAVATDAPLGPGPTAPTTLPPIPQHPAPTAELAGVELTTIVEGLSQPVWLTAPEGDDRLFVVEQTGLIKILRDGEVLPEPFLDVTGDVGDRGTEQGLLGLAFHPQFADNRRVFLSLVNDAGDSRILEYLVDESNPDLLDPLTRRVVMAIDQPHHFHNGGMIQFGPDGYLYIGLGDGGGIGDSYGNGQRSDTIFGTVARIDVDGGRPYAIPPDNPFPITSGAPEVWVYGLRNPWRLTIDAPTGNVYIADVGQDFYEEINILPLGSGGQNYGWPIVEGVECFNTAKGIREGNIVTECDATGTVEPDLVVPHQRACAIVGGPVYRGAAMPELNGHYFYSDYCVGWIRSFEYVDGAVTSQHDWAGELGELGNVTSFGTDGHGEMYVMTLDGELYRFDARRSA